MRCVVHFGAGGGRGFFFFFFFFDGARSGLRTVHILSCIGIGVLPTNAFAKQLGVALTWTNCAEKQIQILCVDAPSIVIIMYSAEAVRSYNT
jgi:hypothetical protein